MNANAVTVKKHFKSLRDYLNALADLKDLHEVGREVATDLEIGAITRRTHELYAPAPLFTNIHGHAGYRVIGAPLSYSSLPQARLARVALALGFDAGTSPAKIVDALAEASTRPPIPPVVVEEGVCQQHVLLGDDADLTKFPTPLIHAGDGGRYFNTLGFWVLRSPDGKWTNWSIARAMLIDGKRMTGLLIQAQHNGTIFRMWQERGEPMPFALVQGAEPAALCVGGMPLPKGVDEANYLGGYFGEPLELVRCKTVDLEVPATAEIIVEGHVAIDETAQDGPMGEYHGYIRDETYTFPVYHVSAITHRDNPILPITAAGKPVDEDHTVWGGATSAMCLRRLRDEGLPVTTAWLVPEAAQHLLAISVARDWPRRTKLSANDLARRIAEIAKAMHGGNVITRVMVCDDDIDVTDMRDLVWAWNSRCHPANGYFVLADQPVNPLEPMYAAEKLSFYGDKAPVGPIEVLNCLLPTRGDDLLLVSDFATNFPKDLQERVIALWDS